MATEGKVGNHLLVGELVPLGALNHSIQNQHVPIGFTGKVEAAHRRSQ